MKRRNTTADNFSSSSFSSNNKNDILVRGRRTGVQMRPLGSVPTDPETGFEDLNSFWESAKSPPPGGDPSSSLPLPPQQQPKEKKKKIRKSLGKNGNDGNPLSSVPKLRPDATNTKPSFTYKENSKPKRPKNWLLDTSSGEEDDFFIDGDLNSTLNSTMEQTPTIGNWLSNGLRKRNRGDFTSPDSELSRVSTAPPSTLPSTKHSKKGSVGSDGMIETPSVMRKEDISRVDTAASIVQPQRETPNVSALTLGTLGSAMVDSPLVNEGMNKSASTASTAFPPINQEREEDEEEMEDESVLRREKAAEPIGSQTPGMINAQPRPDPPSAKSLSVSSMGGGGKETPQMQSRVDPPEKGMTPVTTTPTTNDNENDNGDNSETEQNNEDNADTDMDLVYDNENDDDENGENDEMDEQKNEEDSNTAEDGEKLESSVGSSSLGSRRSNGGGAGTVADIGTASLASSSSSSSVDSFKLGRADDLSAAASKLPPPPPVEDNVEDLLAATSSYHDDDDDDNDDDDTPGFQLHTEEEEVEDTETPAAVRSQRQETAKLREEAEKLREETEKLRKEKQRLREEAEREADNAEDDNDVMETPMEKQTSNPKRKSILSTPQSKKRRSKKKRVTYATPTSKFGQGYPADNREYQAIPVSDYKSSGEEELPSPSKGGPRRSGRVRFPPLAYWKNERLVFEAHNETGELGRAMGDMPVVSGVITALPTPYKKKRGGGGGGEKRGGANRRKKRGEDEDEEGRFEGNRAKDDSLVEFDSTKIRKVGTMMTRKKTNVVCWPFLGKFFFLVSNFHTFCSFCLLFST